MKTHKTQYIFFTILIVLVFSPFLKSTFAGKTHESPRFHALLVAQADNEDDSYDVVEDDEEIDDEEFDEEVSEDFDDEDVIPDVETDEDDLIDQIDTQDEKAENKNPAENTNNFLKDAFGNSYYRALCDPSECGGHEIIRIDNQESTPKVTCLKPGSVIEIMNDTDSVATIYFDPPGLTDIDELHLKPRQRGQVTVGSKPMHGKMTAITESPGNPVNIYTRYEYIVICPRP